MFLSLRFTAISVLFVSLLCLGCNNSTGRPLDPGKPIVIQITYDGDPIAEGNVDLTGMGGGAPLTPSGEAAFEHVPFGNYRVIVQPPHLLSDVIPPETPPERRVSNKPPKTTIANKFRNEQTTPLEINVQEGKADRFAFDLKK